MGYAFFYGSDELLLPDDCYHSRSSYFSHDLLYVFEDLNVYVEFWTEINTIPQITMRVEGGKAIF